MFPPPCKVQSESAGVIFTVAGCAFYLIPEQSQEYDDRICTFQMDFTLRVGIIRDYADKV